MRTVCPSCDTAYTIPDDRIGPKGRKVRCTRCGDEWRVHATDAEPTVDAVADPSTARTPADDFDAIDFDAPAAAENPGADPFAALRETIPDADDTDTLDEDGPSLDELMAMPAQDAGPEADAAEAPAAPTPSPAPRRGPIHRRRSMFRVPAFVGRLAPFGGPALFVVVCLTLAGFVGLRGMIAAHVPALAGFYRFVGLDVNVRGIVFGSIETLRETEDGKPVLVVEGSFANTTEEAREVPALRFALRDGDAQELYVWSLDPRAKIIAAGDRLQFRTRLVAPPDRAADLQVRFAERRNRQAGLP